jgi:signal transduction histidine kinase
MKIQLGPVDMLHDVLEPVASMLYQRGSDFQVLLECPENLVLVTDKLRLKQTCLNLGRNATKFVHKGFVRLRAAVVDGMVHVYIEDSGPGISEEKRQQLFGKFQEALDTLNQGTGMVRELFETWSAPWIFLDPCCSNF